MGAADIIPGVSGGTMALITGIYEELIESIDRLNLSLLSIGIKEGFTAFWKAANGRFLLPLFLGIGSSIVFMSGAIDYMLNHHPILLWSFFFGLIIASILLLFSQLEERNFKAYLFLLLGFIIAFGITKINPAGTSSSILYLFFCSTIAIMAMILPGISGAFLFILFGVYEEVLTTVRMAPKVLFSSDWEAIKTVYLKVIVIGLGIVTGLKIFSKVLKWLFNHHRQNTLAVLIGFMTGALPKIWPWKKEIGPDQFENINPLNLQGESQLLFALLTMILGGILLILINRYAAKK